MIASSSLSSPVAASRVLMVLLVLIGVGAVTACSSTPQQKAEQRTRRTEQQVEQRTDQAIDRAVDRQLDRIFN